MDATLFENVNSTTLTPARLASAKVPFDLAHWYHTIGSRAARLTSTEIDKVMRVRLMVLRADA